MEPRETLKQAFKLWNFRHFELWNFESLKRFNLETLEFEIEYHEFIDSSWLLMPQGSWLKTHAREEFGARAWA